MAIATYQTTIKADPQRTWEAFTNFEKGPERIRAIESMEILERGDAGGVGMRFRETRRQGKRLETVELLVTKLGAPHEICIECDACGGLFKSTYKFNEVELGTEVSLEMSFKPRTLLAKICTPLKGFLLGICLKQMREDIEDLRALLERA